MNIRKRWTKEEVVVEFNKIHNNFYDYSEVFYTKMHDKVIIKCPVHGNFSQEVNAHLRGQGCSRCKVEINPQLKSDTTESFIEKAKAIHGNLFDYSKVIYGKNAHDKVTLICSKHGDFQISPNSHLSKKSGCLICANFQGGWSRDRWINLCGDRKACLYLVKCWSIDEEFLKIGITFKDLKSRLGYKSRLPYNYEVVKIIESYDAGSIFDLEATLAEKFNHLKYIPKIFFDGASECFILTSEIII